MEAGSSHAEVELRPTAVQNARRKLMLRDGLKFLTLTVVAVVLSGVTTPSSSGPLRAAARNLPCDGLSAAGKLCRLVIPLRRLQQLRVSLSYRPDD